MQRQMLIGEILRLWDEGYKQKDIAKRTGFSLQHISKILQDEGCASYKYSAKRKLEHKLPDITMAIQEGATWREVMYQFGVTQHSRCHLPDSLKEQVASNGRKKRRQFTEEQYDRIVQEVLVNGAYKTAQKFSLNAPTIQGIMYRRGYFAVKQDGKWIWKRKEQGK